MIAIYSRKSKYTGKGESIENQIELCRRYIRNRMCAPDEDILVYEDEGFSGGNLDRPQFKRLMSDACNRRIGAIVCYRLDRISRNIGDFAKLIEELNGFGVSFISIKEQFDTVSPLGRAMMYIASVFSQLERETIAERIRDNMLELAKTGRWLGGVTPTGYASESVDKITVDGKLKKAHRLKLIPEEADLIKKIFETFLKTGSLTMTETHLLLNGIRTKNQKYFTRFTIKSILQNPVYMTADCDAYRYFTEKKACLYASIPDFGGTHGVMAYNKTLQKHGKANRPRDMSEWIVTAGTHRGIISGADFIRAGKLLESNKGKAYRKPKKSKSLISGLLRCGGCGALMRPKLLTNQEPRFSYLCGMKEKSRGVLCGMKNPDGIILDAAICEEIKKISPDLNELIRNIDKGREKIKEESIRIKVSTDELNKSGFDTKINDEEFSLIRRILSDCRSVFDGMSDDQKRVIIRELAEKIVWDGEKLHLSMRGYAG